MALTKRVFEISSTTSWVEVSGYDADSRNNHVMVENYTDGDVWVAFDRTDYPDLIVLVDTDKTADFFPTHGKCYVKNASGTGGQVLLSVWQTFDR